MLPTSESLGPETAASSGWLATFLSGTEGLLRRGGLHEP